MFRTLSKLGEDLYKGYKPYVGTECQLEEIPSPENVDRFVQTEDDLFDVHAFPRIGQRVVQHPMLERCETRALHIGVCVGLWRDDIQEQPPSSPRFARWIIVASAPQARFASGSRQSKPVSVVPRDASSSMRCDSPAVSGGADRR